jgi:hypothetical protein
MGQSGYEVVEEKSNFNIANYSTDKFVIEDPKTQRATISNSSGSDLELKCGMLLGKISATQELAVLKSGATDGSQFPVGFVVADRTIPDGDSVEIPFYVSGSFQRDLVILDGTDTLATVVSGRSIEDRIAADTVGILLVDATELSEYDNQ